MRFKSLLIALSTTLLASNCKTMTPSSQVKEDNGIQFNTYETVNYEPQFADGDDHFLFYWAVWRQLSPAERDQLGPELGMIISQRDIYWSVDDCTTGARLNMDGENIWYRDDLKLNQDGNITPIKEAPRAGYRYFVMANINSQHLRGAGPWIGPKKERGETMEQWDQRRHKAYLEWLGRSWAKGTRGQINLTSTHRLFKQMDLVASDAWISPKDYPQVTGEALQLITKYSPKQWPVYFDERAHKPHMFSEPQTWKKTSEVVSEKQFRMRLDWNWCEPSKPVQVEVFVPKGELPPGGPNRPGRSDSGQRKIKITEINWP